MAQMHRIASIRRQSLAAVLTGLVAGAVGGCTKPEPAADVALTWHADETNYGGALSEAEARNLDSSFGAVASGQSAVNRPVAASETTGGGRWEDVYSAVLYALDDIEAAVVRKRLYDWGWEIHFRTVEDWPGTLHLARAPFLLTAGRDAFPPGPPPSTSQPVPNWEFKGGGVATKVTSLYEASARVGRFEDQHIDRAQALLEAFDKHLREFGKKKRLPE